MQFEDILEEVGSFGLYQKLLCMVFLPLTTGLVAFTYYVQLFVLTAPQHRCHVSAPGAGNTGTQEDAFYSHVEHLINNTKKNAPALEPFTCHQYPGNVSGGDFSFLINS